MSYAAYFVPALILLICALLYVIESKAKKNKWIYSVSLTLLHIFGIAYFLFIELGMEILLLFLLASLALSITVKRSQP
jgi:hypothetical protein